MLTQNENDNMKPGIVRTPKSWREFRAINSHDDSFYTYYPGISLPSHVVMVPPVDSILMN